ncbi:zinc finger BED domain-containing protein RICESLEEPER [Trifolium repens]|nr:zinc finger BED domain-containing protein RICESLEEPER [Trifolium repens]
MDLNRVVAVMAVDMKSKYDKYWGDVVKMNQFLYFGVVFDPRFKFDFIEWSFEDMYGAGSELAKDMALSSSSQVQTTVVPSIFARKDAYKQHLKQKVTIEQQNELESWLKPSMVDNNDLIEEEYELSLNAITDVQNMLVGGGTSGASGSGTAGEAPPASGPPV